MAVITGMNKILVISAITLVAVVMGMSLVTPALANDPRTEDHIGVLVFSSGCGKVPSGLACVAADADNDGTCDSPAFLIPRAVADRLGIQTYQECFQPTS